MGIFLVASPVYAALIWYIIWSWRRLEPEAPFAAQARRLLLGIIGFSAIWLILLLCVLTLASMLYLGVKDPHQQALFGIALFVPVLPYYGGVILASPLSFFGLPPEVYTYGTATILGSILTAPLVLLLISLIEWGILRLTHNDRPKVNYDR